MLVIKMTRIYHIFFAALGFFTKIPIPKSVDFNKVKQGEATLLLPVIGIIVGGGSALTFVVLQFILPLQIAVALSMLFSIYITSAFHEDGLADMVDGFGGGWTKERILEIMKDSSIGTYGVLALILSLGLKYISFISLPFTKIAFAIVVGHIISRAFAVSLMSDLDYSRTENSKAASFTKRITKSELSIIMIVGILSLLLFNNYYSFVVLLPLLFVRIYLKSFYKKWIDGYTGDCIGAAQQIFELVFLLTILAIYHSNLIGEIY